MYNPATASLSALFLAGAAVTLTLCVYAALGRKTTPGAGVFSLLMAAFAVYCFGASFEINAGSLERIMAWVKVEYVGITFIPPLWLILAVEYTRGGRHLPRWVTTALLLLSAALLILNVTNERHHLYYTSLTLDASGPFPMARMGHGPFFYVLVAYQFVCMAVGIGLFFRSWLRAAPSARRQATGIVVASLFPPLADILYVSGLSPYGIDVTPLGCAVSGLLAAVSTLRFHFLDVVPVALDVVFRTIQDGVLILDFNGKVVEANARAQAVLGGKEGLRTGATLGDLLAARPELAERLHGGPGRTEDVTIEVDGETRRFDIRISPVTDHQGHLLGRTIILVDTTDRARLLEEMRRLAITDELTGLPNRRHFIERARIETERASRLGKPVSVIAIDLDHFKLINDSRGHAAGDAVLKGVASAWRESLRSFDLLGRCGGEEFLVILPETALETAAMVAERMRAATEALGVSHDGAPVRVTASFGAACFTGQGAAGLDALLSRADRALYAAKEGGRNQVRSVSEDGRVTAARR